MRWSCLLVVVVAGCASANVGGGDKDANGGADGSDPVDAPPSIDAPLDAPAAVAVNLVQTGSAAVTATQIGCQQTNPLTNFTTENSYYRTFPLADFGITTPLTIRDVTFAVERATAGNGVSQPVQLKLGTYSGTINATSFAVNQLTQLASATIQVPNNTTTPVTTPISAFTPSTLTIPPGSILYAEVFIPDGRPAGNIFYIGSNAGTETHPSYIRATDCSVLSPTAYLTAIGATPVIRILLSVNGTH